MYITISGTAGSGKSTLAKMLAEKLGWPYISVGSVRRKMAEERGMTLAEFNELGEKDPSTDVDVDQRIKEEVLGHPNAIAEGRVQYHFIPDSLKLFLKTDLDVSAQRIWKDIQAGKRSSESHFKSFEEVKQSIIERQNSDTARYKKYYNLDPYNESNFDFVLDTTNNSNEQTLQTVMKLVDNYKKKA